MIHTLDGHYKFLSNFYQCQIEYQGLVYPSVENAYQAMKTKEPSLRLQFQDITAWQARALGNKIVICPEWEIGQGFQPYKLKVMTELLKIKFLASELKEKLLLTGNRYIVEGNWWHDNYWGLCTCKSCHNKQSKNMLGNLLMELRKSLY